MCAKYAFNDFASVRLEDIRLPAVPLLTSATGIISLPLLRRLTTAGRRSAASSATEATGDRARAGAGRLWRPRDPDRSCTPFEAVTGSGTSRRRSATSRTARSKRLRGSRRRAEVGGRRSPQPSGGGHPGGMRACAEAIGELERAHRRAAARSAAPLSSAPNSRSRARSPSSTYASPSTALSPEPSKHGWRPHSLSRSASGESSPNSRPDGPSR
jgi:hypothetical protein